ncbi:MAG: hypothetical protein K0U98_06375 [Deltaproteobacteria bacterium]|nr:hypothetical protein [Deltaproteobacteria bacterium]
MLKKTKCLLVVAAYLFTQPLLAQDKVSPVDKPPVDSEILGPTLNTLNQPPNQVNGFFSDSDCQSCGTGAQTVADNFEIDAPGPGFRFRIDQVVIWGGYLPGNTPSGTDDFTIQLRSDSAGAPGNAPLYSAVGLQPDSRVDAGFDVMGADVYEFTFNLATPANWGNGTWWIEIHNNTAATAGVDFFWVTGTVDDTHGIPNCLVSTEVPADNSFGITTGDLAIQLNGVNVPVELMSFSID